jgi:hypothetical protein
LDAKGTPAQRSGEAEAVILVKALPQVGEKHGETVCVAAIDAYRNWLRLYPIAFRHLEDEQKFTRWDRIRFKWRLPEVNRDNRIESRNVDQQSIEVIGSLRKASRASFLEPMIARSTKKERAEGRSLALIQPDDPQFFARRRSPDAMQKRQDEYAKLLKSPDLFAAKELIPLRPAPYEFGYTYRDDDGSHVCLCHDWEIEQTYLNWSRKYGEQDALQKLYAQFGERFPSEGMMFALGTHSRYPDVWMIIGVIKSASAEQGILI